MIREASVLLGGRGEAGDTGGGEDGESSATHAQ